MIQRFDLAGIPASPWKNGGGETREIVCRPAGSGSENFAWRVSVARINSDGPFSLFPGVDRVITLLEGKGISLKSPDGDIDHILDRPLIPFAFPGEAAIRAEMLGGESLDFNVMTRRSVCAAEFETTRRMLFRRLPSAGLVMAGPGKWKADVTPGLNCELENGQGFWWEGETAVGKFEPLNNNSVLIIVKILIPET